MPTVAENVRYWKAHDWGQRGLEWCRGYGGIEKAWEHAVWPRIRVFLPAGHVLELGPGYGAWTDYLRPLAKRMTLVDLAPNCIEACRGRFGRRRAAGSR